MDIKTLDNIETSLEENLFEGDEFKTKWHHYYKETQDKSILQRLYNIGLITKEDYILMTGEEPQEKTEPSGIIIDIKKDILAQDRFLLNLDLKLLSLDLDIPVFLDNSNQDYFTFLKRIIDNKNYNNKQEIINIVEFYHSKNKISVDYKNNLIELINSNKLSI